MTGSLAAFQSGLGRALQGEDGSPIDARSPGFRFTMSVRRSWCEGRAIMAARTVMTAMTDGERRRLFGEYVDRGGGAALSLAAESEAFLAFLAPRLPDPSHALTICRIDQALTQARSGASSFAAPRLQSRARPVGRGRHAALVWFHADPGAVMMALKGGKLPPVGPADQAVLLAPGLPNLFRTASQAEAALWATLPAAHAPPALIGPLLREGVLEYPA
jgi:hypothetical protein